MGKILSKINIFASIICGYFLAILMIMLLLDIFFRTIGKPIIGIAELSMFVMLTTVYLGMGECERVHGHVKVDFITDKLPTSIQKYFKIFSHIICFITLIICSYSMITNTIDSYNGNEAIAGLISFPVWPVKLLMSIGLLLYCLQALYNLYCIIFEINSTSQEIN